MSLLRNPEESPYSYPKNQIREPKPLHDFDADTALWPEPLPGPCQLPEKPSTCLTKESSKSYAEHLQNHLKDPGMECFSIITYWAVCLVDPTRHGKRAASLPSCSSG